MIINTINEDVPKIEVNWGTLSYTTAVTDVPVEFESKFPDYITINWGNPPDITMINAPIEIKIDLKTIDLNKDHGCVALVPYKI